ncbi:ABC transporter permease [Garciella nitratireducens]|uniref:Putative ABC transport system permease protein n=1 Tax=Garciella nitratireducens DSM 15102 TaxID=1121911 RepID=A0A1T4MHS8_9FIRM|nr:FtsX-like permease family protein [Garciella nitratireducens]SJZ66569.1 putative ABC transport system permease protein [Garciella nitratireducens DSM 15102]
MSKFFYVKMAGNNIRKNRKLYIPYLLTCIGMIVMFYNMCFLAQARDILKITGGETLKQILFFGMIVTAIFSIIFLFYTNSFLIKQRKKEFGIFHVLGMEKKHIAKLMFFETFLIGLISIIGGILTGILLSKLMLLLLFKIISFEVPFGFEIPINAVIFSIFLFSGIFLANLIYNLFQVYQSKPIELLKGGNVGEKEPKIKWILTIIGVACLGSGYYIALTTESPLAALKLFFIAVILVILGTYCLFTAGSIAILKLLRKNKRYYYKSNHFISISGMIYRMKQNAIGLANICILSTMVIVMLSTTVSLYVGMEDVLRTRYPRDIMIYAEDISDHQAQKLNVFIEKQIKKNKMIPQNFVQRRFIQFTVFQNGNKFTSDAASLQDISTVEFILLDDYNKMENQSISLSKGEALLYTARGSFKGDIINFDGTKLSIKKRLSSFNMEGKMLDNVASNYFIVVVNDINTINQIFHSVQEKQEDIKNLSYYYAFDVNGDREQQIELIKDLRKGDRQIVQDISVDAVAEARESFFSFYGGLFFLGIFLGFLFIMATVLIIYYKQIAEGYDDRKRFSIMQKVGMSQEEIKGAIRSQVLMVFFLPLITAVIHLLFAFKVITQLLSIFNLTNISLFAGCTAIIIIIFAIFYSVIYALTARTYYKIVR